MRLPLDLKLDDGRVLIVGGYDSVAGPGANFANVFDPATRTWQAGAAPMAQRRWRPTATTLGDGRILVTGGATTCLTCTADVPEIYNPATDLFTNTAAMSGGRYGHRAVKLNPARLYTTGTATFDGTTTITGTNTLWLTDAVAVGDRIREWRYAGETIAINAYDPAFFREVSFGRWPVVDGSKEMWERIARGEAIGISSSFAANFGVRLGDMLAIDTREGGIRLPVAGILTEFSSARGTIVMSRELYAQHWNDDQVTLILVETDGADAVRAAIARTLAGTKWS